MSLKPPNPAIPLSRDVPSFNIPGEERLLQNIVKEVVKHHMWITCLQELIRWQERPRICLGVALTAALSRKQCESAGGVKPAVANDFPPERPWSHGPRNTLAICTRTRAENDERHFIQFSGKEVDELVDAWTPEPLGGPFTPEGQSDFATFSIYNFTGLAGNEGIKLRAIETLRKYGVGFHGTIDVHTNLERDIADFLGTEASILYSQGFSTILCVISAFAKRANIIVADRGLNFAIQKGLQISRSTVRWFYRNNLKSLEDVLLTVEKERRKCRGPLTRRFIVTEGIFEKDGAMVDLPKLIELKDGYRYRLILDESISSGTVGRTGHGLTELYNVPIPGSHFIARYIKSSHQNDPGRTVLEILLALFAIRTLVRSRTRAENDERRFIQFSEKVGGRRARGRIDPNPIPRLPVVSGANGHMGKHVLNLASYNFTGLAGNEVIKVRAIETLRKYGVGSCGLPGFYGTIDVHTNLERDIADFLGTDISILYLLWFSTIPCKGLRISRSTVRWFDHNDLKGLEDVFLSVEKERCKRRGPLTRRSIVTDSIFEKDVAMVGLPKLIELKHKYKYRLILDGSVSFRTVGRTGRGLTELYNVPATQIDMIIGSVANTLNSLGGFCAGSRIAINILRNMPSILSTLQENVRTIRAVLDRVEAITIPSHPASPIIHIHLRSAATLSASTSVSAKPPNPATPAPHDAPLFDIAGEERQLQDIVDDALAQGVIRLAVTAALSRKECERAAGVIKAAVVKVLTKRK
ncbi:pyridoxal phosphate-dependent transferase [Lactarius hengduanensis]|nr:pyridoxal phosphate-dependent transferase [Lactarius hengduanensis]